MLKRLKKLYKQEQFNPKILRLAVNPFYFAKKSLWINALINFKITHLN
jgi:hypothetical protein